MLIHQCAAHKRDSFCNGAHASERRPLQLLKKLTHLSLLGITTQGFLYHVMFVLAYEELEKKLEKHFNRRHRL